MALHIPDFLWWSLEGRPLFISRFRFAGLCRVVKVFQGRIDDILIIGFLLIHVCIVTLLAI